jgi:DNA anti-recombination protein RmuC
MDKDLGQELENMEEGIENLKNKEFRILGIKVSFMSVSALLAVLGSVIGALYAGFLMYQKVEQAIEFVDQQQEYEEKIAGFEQRMEVIETKLEEAVDYTRDIKSGLRDDILGIEKQVDRMEDKLRESEAETRAIIQSAEERFENKRDALQNDYDEKANRLSETSTSRMDELNEKVDRNIDEMENKIEREMSDLENRLTTKLQRALDNPLAN